MKFAAGTDASVYFIFFHMISISLDPKVKLRCRDCPLSVQLSTALLEEFVAAYRANLP